MISTGLLLLLLLLILLLFSLSLSLWEHACVCALLRRRRMCYCCARELPGYCGYLCLGDEREWRATARDGELVDSRYWL